LYIPNGQVSLRTAARANENGQKLFSLGRRRRRERNAIARARIRSGKAVDRDVIFSARRRTLLKQRENNENTIQARISREHYGEIAFTESRNKDDFETVMGVRKEVFARAKLFELWGKFELNFDLFSQKCWQILKLLQGAQKARRKSAPTRERALKAKNTFL
jgi:hypothetical protein